MKNKEIKKCLIDLDLTITDLAKRTGFSRVHISNVVNGHWNSKNVRDAVTRVIGKNLWGEDALLADVCQDRPNGNE